LYVILSFETMKKCPILIITAVLILATAAFLFKVHQDMVDFEVNYHAGQRLQLAETLYRAGDGHYQFKYLPAAAFLYLPLAMLPLETAKAVWFLLILCGMGLLGWLSFRLLPKDIDYRRAALWLPPLILLRFFLRELDLGQINALVTLVLIVMSWTLVRRPRSEVQAGLLWGLAMILKPYALIFLPYYLVKRKWKALCSGLGALLLALTAPALYYGWKGNLLVIEEWLSTFSRSTPTLLTTLDNVSLTAFFTKWIPHESTALVLAGAAVILLGILIFLMLLKGRARPEASVLEVAMLLTAIPLVSPLGWDYTFLMSLPALQLIVGFFRRYPRPWRVILAVDFGIIALSLYDFLGRELYGAFMSRSVLTLNFLLLVGALAALRFRDIA